LLRQEILHLAILPAPRTAVAFGQVALCACAAISSRQDALRPRRSVRHRCGRATTTLRVHRLYTIGQLYGANDHGGDNNQAKHTNEYLFDHLFISFSRL
jgi:hypothetical protein